MAISYPPVLINEYLAEKVPQRLPGRFNGQFRFFPTKPTDINSLIKNNPGTANDVFGIYDRMFKLRRGPFPHIKQEQTVYYFYKYNSDPEALIETVQVIYDLLDRGDESAQELNAWISGKVNNSGLVTFGSGRLAKQFKPIFFHEMKIYQIDEARYIIDHETARTFSATKLIISYDYHTKDYS